MSSSKRTSIFRRRRLWVILLVVVLLALPVFLLAMRHVDREGLAFFNTGKEILHDLDRLADGLEARDVDTLGTAYTDDFSGELLGLGDLALVEERDGVRVYRFTAAGGTIDRDAAAREWVDYLESFDEIEEVGLFIHRLEDWQSSDGAVATIRFELIGTPRGETRSGIDRAFFRMRFVPTDDGWKIASSSLVEGDRVIASEPHFVDVAAEAGIDFENQYYPRFLSEPLEFGMLRYGPAGITAADVDDDGFYDLFIPDGVESRLFRNLGPGPEGEARFDDVTEEVGLSGLDGVSVGLFADFDNDGLKDFFVSRTFTPNQIFRNLGPGPDGLPRFEDVTAEVGIGEDCCTTVASVADVDNDGDLDLYVGRYLDPRLAIPTTFYARNGEPNQLYRNDGVQGSGWVKFTNVTEEAGVGELGLCLGTVFGDYDNDGDADLYVVNDFGRKTLYRNEGDGTFTDVTVETNTLAYGAGMSASFGDYDNDGWLDIYVAHIRSEEGWFAEQPTVMRYMLNTWRQGVWMTDMPLYLEIFKQSGMEFVKVFQDMASGNTLLRNRGDGTFEDVTWETNANPPGWFWGSGFYDFDNDGLQDIYAANGWVYNEEDTEIELDFLNNVVSEMQEYKTGSFFDPANFDNQSWHGWERNRHLRAHRDESGQIVFREIGRAAGTDLILNSRGIAVADYWNRGVLDVAVAASTDRHALLRNDVGAARNWLAVELVGAGDALPDGTNRDAVGARAIVRSGGVEQLREVFLGDGYGSQNSLRLYFGLGDAAVIDELEVIWPRSGSTQSFSNLEANGIVEIVEGRGEVVEKVYTAEPLDEPAAEATGDETDV